MLTHHMSGTPVYAVWNDMVRRCKNPTHASFENYGARGITVCERWLSFSNFYADMGPRPQGATLDRIDNDKGYFSANCRWASRTTQSINRRVFRVNKTGLAGVFWHRELRKFVAYIRINNRQKHLCLTADFFEACCTRKAAEIHFFEKGARQ